MSTHCNIGIMHPDGTVQGCYVHMDGYPDNMVPSLVSYISQRTTTGLALLISQAATGGGFHSFSCTLAKADYEFRDYEPELLDKCGVLDFNGCAPFAYLVCLETADIECWEKDYDAREFVFLASYSIDGLGVTRRSARPRFVNSIGDM